MRYAANDNWPEGQPRVVAHVGWGNSLSTNLQVQDRIGTALRAMYADLLQQPLSYRLVKLTPQINTRLETSRHVG